MLKVTTVLRLIKVQNFVHRAHDVTHGQTWSKINMWSQRSVPSPLAVMYKINRRGVEITKAFCRKEHKTLLVIIHL